MIHCVLEEVLDVVEIGQDSPFLMIATKTYELFFVIPSSNLNHRLIIVTTGG